MGHNVGTAAANAVKKSERVKPGDRTPEQILKDIRGNLAAHLFVTPNDQRWLLARYDEAVQAVVDGDFKRGALGLENESIKAENVRLTVQVEEFRSVYEQENRCQTLTLECVLGDVGSQEAPPDEPGAACDEVVAEAADALVDHGGES